MKAIQLTVDGKSVVVMADNIASLVPFANGTRVSFGGGGTNGETLNVQESVSTILTLADIELSK